MFDPVIAAIRFGEGLSPRHAPPPDVAAMLAALTGPDRAAEAFPIAPFSQAYPSIKDHRAASQAVRQAEGAAAQENAEAARDAVRAAGRDALARQLMMALGRSVHTGDGLRERLTRFWADHFTVRAVQGITRHLVAPYVEEAIRPRVTARFSDMLRAAVTHPMMLIYLDQVQSMGPNSKAARNNDRGLNENLAREMLELHTLGVGAAYDQRDVRELAELLTGLTYHPERGFLFRHAQAEPGPELVLGTSYGGGDPATLDEVLAAVDDLAVHPDTARHIARKLAVHFVADDPDPGLVAALEARFAATGGDLLAVTEALLAHPASWDPAPRKVKPPFDFVASALRALEVPAEAFHTATLQQARGLAHRPMRLMGQSWQEPVGPDGWPEAAEAWVTPQGMAARITWAMEAPKQMLDRLPDPRDFVHQALGPEPPGDVVFAAHAAEQVSDGIGIVLASPAFNRR